MYTPDPSPYSFGEQMAIAALAAQIIPASETYDLPGANDKAILADILTTGAPLHGTLRRALAALVFGTKMNAEKARIFRRSFPKEAALIQTLTATCYYRDERVMRSLNIEARPPFPKGYTQIPNDYSLLDPVRKRGEIYRKVE